jgi:hypothetical protein
MATVVPHIRMSWGGTLASGEEIWTNTLNWANDQSTTPTRESLANAAEAVSVPLGVWLNSAEAQICGLVNLEWVKLNYILGNGRQRDTDTVQFDYVPPVTGTLSFNAAPIWVQSYALTLRTGLSRGRGHAGRIFPPMCGKPESFVGGTGYLTKSVADGMALKFGTAIRDIRDAMNPMLQPVGNAYDLVVISVSQTGDTRPPQSNEVVSVVCDRVPDIQHRRSNRLPRSEGNTVVIADIP